MNNECPPEVMRKMTLLRQVLHDYATDADALRALPLSRSSLYRYRKRLTGATREAIIEAMKDRPPVARHHPMALSDSLVRTIVRMSDADPRRGSVWIQRSLAACGIRVSRKTVHKTMVRFGLGTRKARLDKSTNPAPAPPAASAPPDTPQAEESPSTQADAILAGLLNCGLVAPLRFARIMSAHQKSTERYIRQLEQISARVDRRARSARAKQERAASRIQSRDTGSSASDGSSA